MINSYRTYCSRFSQKSKSNSIINTIIIVVLLIISGCSISESKIVGTYKLYENNFTFDTLNIYDNHTYKQLLYSKENDSLYYTNTGTWKQDEYNRIFFDHFNANEGRELSKAFTAWESALIDTNVPFRIKDGTVHIIINSDNGIYYEKVE